MTVLYGIKNCDTIKKARKELEQQALEFTFWDYRVEGLSAELLTTLCSHLGWQQLLNTRGTTYRALPESDKLNLTEEKAKALMLAKPTLIKRPVLEHNGKYLVGFSSESYQQFFQAITE